MTLINPCVLPVLLIVLASSLHRDRRAPMALAAGMSLSFVALGLGVTATGPAFRLDGDTVALGAALVMVGFGLVMLMPAHSGRLSTATAGFVRHLIQAFTAILGGAFEACASDGLAATASTASGPRTAVGNLPK